MNPRSPNSDGGPSVAPSVLPPAATSQQAHARLERARAAAEQFARAFDYSEQERARLRQAPIQEPLILERNGVEVEVFRWLGHGRGAPTIQVELDTRSDEATVYGARGDSEFGPWKPRAVPATASTR